MYLLESVTADFTEPQSQLREQSINQCQDEARNPVVLFLDPPWSHHTLSHQADPGHPFLSHQVDHVGMNGHVDTKTNGAALSSSQAEPMESVKATAAPAKSNTPFPLLQRLVGLAPDGPIPPPRDYDPGPGLPAFSPSPCSCPGCIASAAGQANPGSSLNTSSSFLPGSGLYPLPSLEDGACPTTEDVEAAQEVYCSCCSPKRLASAAYPNRTSFLDTGGVRQQPPPPPPAHFLPPTTAHQLSFQPRVTDAHPSAAAAKTSGDVATKNGCVHTAGHRRSWQACSKHNNTGGGRGGVSYSTSFPGVLADQLAAVQGVDTGGHPTPQTADVIESGVGGIGASVSGAGFISAAGSSVGFSGAIGSCADGNGAGGCGSGWPHHAATTLASRLQFADCRCYQRSRPTEGVFDKPVVAATMNSQLNGAASSHVFSSNNNIDK